MSGWVRWARRREARFVPTCDMQATCIDPPSWIDDKGYIYCDLHGELRSHGRPCRPMTPAEVERIMGGRTVEAF